MQNLKQKKGANRKEENTQEGPEEFEKVVHINRCANVVAGGRRFSFAAFAVWGDYKGTVGMGYGKAQEVPSAIKKATERARKQTFTVPLKGTTIHHEVIGTADGGRVLLRPACPGTGIIAGGAVRAVLEAAGIKDVLSKSLGSNNPQALAKATKDALEQLRSTAQIEKIRGVSLRGAKK